MGLYTANCYIQEDADEPKGIDVKGLAAIRRNYCPLVRRVCMELLDSLCDFGDLKLALALLRRSLKRLAAGFVPIHQLKLTKKLAGSYAPGAKQVHLEVVKKMRERDPASAPSVGARVPYLLIINGETELSLRSEDPQYVKEHNLPIDLEYYLMKQLKNPVCEILRFSVPDPTKLFKEAEAIIKRNSAKILGNIFRAKHNIKDISSYFSGPPADTSTTEITTASSSAPLPPITPAPKTQQQHKRKATEDIPKDAGRPNDAKKKLPTTSKTKEQVTPKSASSKQETKDDGLPSTALTAATKAKLEKEKTSGNGNIATMFKRQTDSKSKKATASTPVSEKAQKAPPLQPQKRKAPSLPTTSTKVTNPEKRQRVESERFSKATNVPSLKAAPKGLFSVASLQPNFDSSMPPPPTVLASGLSVATLARQQAAHKAEKSKPQTKVTTVNKTKPETNREEMKITSSLDSSSSSSSSSSSVEAIEPKAKQKAKTEPKQRKIEIIAKTPLQTLNKYFTAKPSSVTVPDSATPTI